MDMLLPVSSLSNPSAWRTNIVIKFFLLFFDINVINESEVKNLISMELIKDSIRNNTRLWIALWILLMLNIFTVLALSRGFSLLWVVLILLLTGSGILVIESLAREMPVEEDMLPPELKADLDTMMEEMKPLCDNIFSEKIEEMTVPLIENLSKDFTKGLEWLWEDGDDFLVQVDESIAQTASTLNLIDSLSEEKSKLARQIQENLVLLSGVVSNMRTSRENSFLDLNDFLQGKVDDLKKGLEKEKDIFYDYIYKLLWQQVKLQQEEEIEDITEYFNVYKLGEQFSVIMEKTLEGRLLAFQDSIIRELENFSADVVGGMQKNTLKLRNTLQEIEEMLMRLINDYRGENSLILRRLDEAIERIKEVEEKSGDILVTLAWQDILVEKRWHDISEKLYGVKDRVLENVDNDVVDYISNNLDKEIRGFSALARNQENMVFYKSVVDAELIYQLYSGGKLLEVIGDGVYSLLQFVRPVENLMSKSLRLSEEGVKNRKAIRAKVKSGEYQQLFNRVLEVTEGESPALANYLDDVFPKLFNSFCNNPYIKQKPDNLNQAAWSLFMELIQNPSHGDELYLLVGDLMVIHLLRNKYLHPLKNTPIDLQYEDDLLAMRQAAVKAIDLVLNNNVRGMVRLAFRSH